MRYELPLKTKVSLDDIKKANRIYGDLKPGDVVFSKGPYSLCSMFIPRLKLFEPLIPQFKPYNNKPEKESGMFKSKKQLKKEILTLKNELNDLDAERKRTERDLESQKRATDQMQFQRDDVIWTKNREIELLEQKIKDLESKTDEDKINEIKLEHAKELEKHLKVNGEISEELSKLESKLELTEKEYHKELKNKDVTIGQLKDEVSKKKGDTILLPAIKEELEYYKDLTTQLKVFPNIKEVIQNITELSGGMQDENMKKIANSMKDINNVILKIAEGIGMVRHDIETVKKIQASKV